MVNSVNAKKKRVTLGQTLATGKLWWTLMKNNFKGEVEAETRNKCVLNE